ncbi:hypothetical protein M434DRAFT_33636 [Hypoxylon sp. CO27-5]|nr:hypothetical protein M434DRAFT_33636 [Hypoxylon sp. CO27-5]
MLHPLLGFCAVIKWSRLYSLARLPSLSSLSSLRDLALQAAICTKAVRHYSSSTAKSAVAKFLPRLSFVSVARGFVFCRVLKSKVATMRTDWPAPPFLSRQNTTPTLLGLDPPIKQENENGVSEE